MMMMGMMGWGPLEISIAALAVVWFSYRLWSILKRRELRRVCTHDGCGQPIPRGAQFCPRCGHRVGEST